MSLEEVLEHYSREEVAKELADYSRNRWVAVEAPSPKRRMFFRYAGDRPLTISSSEEVPKVIKRFAFARPRAVYATANLYAKLESRRDVDDPGNVYATTAVWDIDNELEAWKLTIEAARLIVDELERHGVVKSVYLKWSGRGCHVHLHEGAFSEELRREHHPLDLAYSVVEYVLRRVEGRVAELAKQSPCEERPLAVENDMDMKRVFTAPLSLHRSLDVVAICFKPDELDEFTPDWLKPGEFRHNPDWREHEVGEADGLAERALAEVGGYFGARVEGAVRTRVGAPAPPRAEAKPKKVAAPRAAKIGRFQVMGLLQAARYYLVKGDLEKAKSFGLNRAIFYAWAKRTGGRVGRAAAARARQRTLFEAEEEREEKPKVESLGDEVAYLSDTGYFAIGEQVQRPEDYDRQIAARISSAVPYEVAWRAALNYLSTFPRDVLLSQRLFFEKAYKPVRDSFHEVIKRYGSRKPGELED